MSEENKILRESVDQQLLEQTGRPHGEVRDSAVEKLKEMKAELDSVQKDSDTQKISDANLKLMDVRRQLESLRNGKNDESINNALKMLPAAITDVASAMNAQGAIDAGLIAAQEEGSEQTQAAVGEALMGAVNVVAVTAGKALKPLIENGKLEEALKQISKWNKNGQESKEVMLASHFTSEVAPGLHVGKKEPKNSGLDILGA